MGIELVIFDCDGVLVDSEILAIEIEVEVLGAAGFPVTADEIAERFIGLSYSSMMKQLEVQFGRPVPDDLNAQMQQTTLDTFPERLAPVVGMPELLATLELSRCVASSSDLDRITLSLGITGLDRFFDSSHIFSAQMVDNGKPAPDLFLHAASMMGVAPDRCLVIEDSPHGVTAAVSAGMKVLGLIAAGHVRPSLAGRLADAGADHIIETPSEISAHL